MHHNAFQKIIFLFLLFLSLNSFCIDQPCDNSIKLMQLKTAPIDLVLDYRSCLDGGALMDYYRVLSNRFDTNPKEILLAYSKGLINYQDMKYILSAVPEYVIDDMDLRLRFLIDRKILILSNNIFDKKIVKYIEDKILFYRKLLEENKKNSL